MFEDIPPFFTALNEMAAQFDEIEDWDRVTKRELAEQIQFLLDLMQMVVPHLIAMDHQIKILDLAVRAVQPEEEEEIQDYTTSSNSYI